MHRPRMPRNNVPRPLRSRPLKKERIDDLPLPVLRGGETIIIILLQLLKTGVARRLPFVSTCRSA